MHFCERISIWRILGFMFPVFTSLDCPPWSSSSSILIPSEASGWAQVLERTSCYHPALPASVSLSGIEESQPYLTKSRNVTSMTLSIYIRGRQFPKGSRSAAHNTHFSIFPRLPGRKQGLGDLSDLPNIAQLNLRLVLEDKSIPMSKTCLGYICLLCPPIKLSRHHSV